MYIYIRETENHFDQNIANGNWIWENKITRSIYKKHNRTESQMFIEKNWKSNVTSSTRKKLQTKTKQENRKIKPNETEWTIRLQTEFTTFQIASCYLSLIYVNRLHLVDTPLRQNLHQFPRSLSQEQKGLP